MPSFLPQNADLTLRPVQYRDWEAVEGLLAEAVEAEEPSVAGAAASPSPWLYPRPRSLPSLDWLPALLRRSPGVHVAERNRQVCGAIEVSPFNSSRTTWQVKQVAVAPEARPQDVGSELLRYCFEAIWEARTWLLETDIHDKSALALYRQNGFQPLAHLTYWTIGPESLAALAEREPDLPDLLPVSNADAPLLYQLDTAAMPPQVRQVFDRHVDDFRTPPLDALARLVRHRLAGPETVQAYAFEPQRKAAIGHFRLQFDRAGGGPHRADLTVHPAYTWLYPELLCQMARLARARGDRPLLMASADYQPEREEFLERIAAERAAHTLMMSRSVWHKLREARPASLEGLQEMLKGLQPAKPVAGRMFWANAFHGSPAPDRSDRPEAPGSAPAGDASDDRGEPPRTPASG